MLLKHFKKRWTNSQGSTIIQNKRYFFGKDLETSFCLLIDLVEDVSMTLFRKD